MTGFLFRALLAGILATAVAAGQTAGGKNTSTPPSNGGNSNSGPNTGRPPQPTPQSQPQPQPAVQQPIFASGNVVVADGTQLPTRVEIIRLCSVNSVRSLGYTDSKGFFSVQLNGQNLLPSLDASDSLLPDTTPGMSTGMRASTTPGGTFSGPSDSLFACELQARSAGYRSSSIDLSARKPLDSPSVGSLVLYPLSKIEGQAVSATAAGASKEARKSFEKGLSEAKKGKFDSAEKEFRRAVELHPKYADAWMELGKTFAQRKMLTDAHDAFVRSIEADPRYVYPYQQLYLVAFQLENWNELADTTTRLLRLNPYEFPAAYYYNGVASYQLKNWDAAEKSLLQAVDVDKRNANPKSRYVLGLVRIQKLNYAGATKSLGEFVALAPNDPQASKVRALIEQLQQAQQ